MQRDLDLLREILLFIEKCSDGFTPVHVDLDGHDNIKIQYHVNLLAEANFIEVIDVGSKQGSQFFVKKITNFDYDYLDAIKDPEIWRKTIEGSKKAGDFTLELLGDLAKGYIKTQIKKQTGIDL